jgi:hypothetical protein
MKDTNETRKARMKRLRREFREGVFARDGSCCVICGSRENLDAHHIQDRKTLPNDGYAVSNGITLCGGDRPGSCHRKAESFHINQGTEWEDGVHPDDLYARIGSSFESATHDSSLLE